LDSIRLSEAIRHQPDQSGGVGVGATDAGRLLCKEYTRAGSGRHDRRGQAPATGAGDNDVVAGLDVVECRWACGCDSGHGSLSDQNRCAAGALVSVTRTRTVPTDSPTVTMI